MTASTKHISKSLVEVIPKEQKLVSLADYASAIRTHFGKSLREFLECCRLLAQARLKIRQNDPRYTGAKGGRRKSQIEMADDIIAFDEWVERELPFSRSTAKKLMAIGENIQKLLPYENELPSEYSKLYILTTFTNAELRSLFRQHPRLDELTHNDLSKWKELRGTDTQLTETTRYLPFQRYEIREDTPDAIKQKILVDEQKHSQYLQEKYAEWVKIGPNSQTERELDLQLLKQIDQDIEERQKTFMSKCVISPSRTREANDVWRQIQTRKFPIENPDGSFHPSDIRNAKNFFHRFVKKVSKDPKANEFKETSFTNWCRENSVICADMSIGKLDEEQRINFMKREYLDLKMKGKKKQADKVIQRLVAEISQSRFTKTKQFAMKALEQFRYEFPADDKKRYVSTIASMNRQVPKKWSSRKKNK